ncbi:MAG: hypothetical protein QOH59_291 [Gemmatimonadales bacterium]|jgi:hypothetical protein|nr:hypothetical protein [Gemmatimonadales bacterium]
MRRTTFLKEIGLCELTQPMSQYLLDILVEYFDMHQRARRIVRGSAATAVGVFH